MVIAMIATNSTSRKVVSASTLYAPPNAVPGCPDRRSRSAAVIASPISATPRDRDRPAGSGRR
jgi:hypothetical protein